ncbi:MAG: ATP-grasp domain-containing protein [bacterium]
MTIPKELVIAVTGLNAGENPQPGVPVIRSLRKAGFTGKIIGLVYDSFESGIYAPDMADEVYEMPYPSEGADAIMARLEYIMTVHTKIDVLVPTLDSELLPYISIENKLKSYGIKMYLPTREQFMMRDKTELGKLNEKFAILTPKVLLINDTAQAYKIPEKMTLPVMVKGRFYEAYKAHNTEEITKYFNSLRAKWGLPIIIQEFLAGEEYNVSAIGDGKGNIVCSIPIKKTVVTEKGKGFAAVVIKDATLDKFTKNIMKSLKWRGPLELEILKSNKDKQYYLLEINPRLPAWIGLAIGAGQNIPEILVKLALGEKITPLKKYTVGKIFVRHSEDIILDIATMGELTSIGELHDLRTKPVTKRKSKFMDN